MDYQPKNRVSKLVRMKIAYLCNYIRRFKSTTQYQRARFLSKKHDLYLFLDRNEDVPENIESDVTIFRSRFDSRSTISGLFHKIWRILMVLRLKDELGIEAVYTLFSPHMILEGFTLKLFGFDWIDDVWDHPILFLESYSDNPFFKSLYSFSKLLLKRADLVILAIEPESMRDFALDEDKTLEVTNGVDPSLYEGYQDLKGFDEFAIFFVGHLRKQRVELLLDSASELKDKDVDFRYHIVGPIHDDRWLNKKIDELDLEDRVKIYGEKDHEETLRIMAKSDICILPFNKLKSTDCIYPIKLFEYLALGKPVIVTGLKGVRRIIEDGKNGLILEENSPKRIAEKIIELGEKPNFVEKLSRNAKSTAEEFRWSKINEKIEKNIRKLEES